MLTLTMRLTCLGLALSLLAPSIAGGQETEEDLAAQIEALRQGQEEIRQQLREIRTLVVERQVPAARAAPAGPGVAGKVFDLGDNPIKGAASARLVLVEFTDYQ